MILTIPIPDQLAEVLGLDRWQADGVLRRHCVVDLTPEEVDRQFQSIRTLESQ